MSVNKPAESWEQEIYYIFQGDSDQLNIGMTNIELIIGNERAKAARHMVDLIRVRYAEEGYISGDVLDDSLAAFFDGELEV